MYPRRLIIILSMLLVLFILSSPGGMSQGMGMQPAWTFPQTDKVEMALLEAIAARGSADYIVDLGESADLSMADSIQDWEARGRFVLAALQETAERSQAPVLATLDANGLSYRSFIAGNEVMVFGGGRTSIESLAALPEVAHIRSPRMVTLEPDQLETAELPVAQLNSLVWGISDSGADDFWSAFGFQGEGILVANIDTGVQWDHPALKQSFKCGTDPSDPACWEDPTNVCNGSACDDNGHGTHTMGTMVADDDPTLSYQAGMAPRAQWIACKGCENRDCTEFALNACADWILAPDGDPNNRPHIVNNSWGGGGGESWYKDEVIAWRAAGIFPAFSAGNDGPFCTSLSSPGDYQESFASGAHDSSGTIAWFSSRGSSVYGHDPFTKPNLSAPGVNVMSTVPADGWGYKSGTSMASPHTAGAVALLWSCNPGLIGNLAATFELLQDNAGSTPDGNCGAPPDGEGNYTYGYGYLDVYQAGLAACLTWQDGPAACFDWTQFDTEYFPGTGLIYALGGRSGDATDGSIYSYNPDTGECLDTGTDMPTPVSNYTVNLVNDGVKDVLCTFGGRDAAGNPTRDVLCYDPLSNTASAVASLPGAYLGYVPGANVVFNNQVYLFGGLRKTTAPYGLARTDRYDPVTQTFTQLGDLSLARSYIYAAVVDGKIYAFGGTVFDGAALIPQTRAEVMADPEGAGTWNHGAAADLPEAYAGGQAFGFDSVEGIEYLAGKVVLLGGGQWPGYITNVWTYDPSSDTYDAGFPDLQYPRRDHAGVFVPLSSTDPADGLPGLWMFGGYAGSDEPPYAPVEFFPLPPSELKLYFPLFQR